MTVAPLLPTPRRRRVLALACGAILASVMATVAAQDRPLTLPGEPSWTPVARAPAWVLGAWPKAGVARIDYPALPADVASIDPRAEKGAGPRAIRIGIPRRLADDGMSDVPPSLSWSDDARGGAAARLEVRSPGALALRVGFDLRGVDPRVELRFAGSRGDGAPVAVFTAAEALRLAGDDGLFWSPSTDGDVQRVEIRRPPGIPAAAAAVRAPRLSHDLVDSRGAGPRPKIGESGSCNVDVICRVGELGSRFVETKDAVAHMRFVVGGSTFICTGTLLVDAIPETQVPYFHGANHCFSDNTNLPPNPTQMQAVANTLNTFWNYEATGCGNLTQAPTTVLAGGATFLYASNQTDGMLLRLNSPAPAIARFAGWNALPLAAGTAVTAIHHPAGDAKKVSTGQVTAQGDFHETGWTSGTTEGGSSGSGLFTIEDGGDYRLRGGLFGGFASCANTGNLGNQGNRDFYSRLDIDIAQMGRWLATPAILFEDGFE